MKFLSKKEPDKAVIIAKQIIEEFGDFIIEDCKGGSPLRQYSLVYKSDPKKPVLDGNGKPIKNLHDFRDFLGALSQTTNSIFNGDGSRQDGKRSLRERSLLNDDNIKENSPSDFWSVRIAAWGHTSAEKNTLLGKNTNLGVEYLEELSRVLSISIEFEEKVFGSDKNQGLIENYTKLIPKINELKEALSERVERKKEISNRWF